jgi:hypothetical protein
MQNLELTSFARTPLCLKMLFHIHRFREWNDDYYKFDTSRCTKYPEFYKSVIRIYDAKTSQEVWKIGVGLKMGEF